MSDAPLLHETPGLLPAAPVQITLSGLLQFLEISPDALIAVNQAGIIIVANKQTEALFGYTREELMGQQLEILLPQRFRGPHSVQRERYFSAPHARSMGTKLALYGQHKNGTEFPADISLRSALLDGVLHTVAAIRDVSEQKMLEEQLQRKNEELGEQYRQLEEVNRLKGEFLANMSHELRTPLNGIIGFADLLYSDLVGRITAEQKEYLGDILTGSLHLLQLINDVLDLEKVEAGRMTFYPEVVDADKLINEIQNMLRLQASDKRVVVKSAVDAGLKEITIDPGKFKQVLYNYLSNAIKFTPEEGHVMVRIKAFDEEHFVLEVEDSGIGIQPEDITRLFVKYQQLDSSTTKKYQGTGLGLALTKRIVEAQGGSVGVLSTPGQGSIFWAVLPYRPGG